MNILIIEDESLAARRLQKMLVRILGNLGEWGEIPATIDWCADPDQAINEAAKGPDLILLDLNLGSFNSLEWIKTQRLPPDRVIVVSADTRYCDEAYALGVFGYNFKPIEEAQLAEHLVRFIKSRNLLA
jgi:two-component system, LytTR family, response regulator LytT